MKYMEKTLKWLLSINDKGEECNMDILSIKIQGFRNIETNFLELGKITSLVSINSYGKSNLIKAIDFAVDFIKSDKDSKSAMMQWSEAVPINKKIQNLNFVADFSFKVCMDDKYYIVNYGYEFEWIKNNKSGAKIIGEWLKLKLDEKGQKPNTLIERNSEGTFYRSSITGRCSNKISIEDNNLVINKLFLYDNLFYNDIITRINKINVYIERHLDTSQSYQSNPIVKKRIDESDLNDINNIPRAIYSIKINYPEKYNILEYSFKQLFTNIESISVEEYSVKPMRNIKTDKNVPFIIENSVYVLSVKEKNLNQPISFERLSDGSRRVFLMLTYAILADIKGLSLIAFEEPENSVHPSLLQSYINVLSQLTNGCKIIITSHSPYILQYVTTEDIYIGIPNPYGLADFKKIDSKKINTLMDDAEDSIGNYIFDLLSGSQDSIEILEEYLEK